jgi:hypothetical protein
MQAVTQPTPHDDALPACVKSPPISYRATGAGTRVPGWFDPESR